MKRLTLMTLATLTSIGITCSTVSANTTYNQFNKDNIIVKKVTVKDLNNIKNQLKKCGIIINLDNILNNNSKPDDNNQNNNSKPDDNNQNNNSKPNDNNQNNNSKPNDNNQNNNSTELTFVQQVVNLVNKERKEAGLKELILDNEITAAAQIRANEIVKSFSHTRPNNSSFSTVLTENNIKFKGCGENIAYGQKSPEEVMKGWMNSKGHRENILNSKFTKIGVGYYQKNGVNYWTQLFTY